MMSAILKVDVICLLVTLQIPTSDSFSMRKESTGPSTDQGVLKESFKFTEGLMDILNSYLST